MVVVVIVCLLNFSQLTCCPLQGATNILDANTCVCSACYMCCANHVHIYIYVILIILIYIMYIIYAYYIILYEFKMVT